MPQRYLPRDSSKGMVRMVTGLVGGDDSWSMPWVSRASGYGVGLNPPPGVYWRLKPPFAPKHGPPVPPLVQFVRRL